MSADEIFVILLVGGFFAVVAGMAIHSRKQAATATRPRSGDNDPAQSARRTDTST